MATQRSGYVGSLTQDQQAALDALCKQLPTSAEDVGLTAKELGLWGVSLTDLDKPTRAQQVVLLKFLRARTFDVGAAQSMLLSCLKWRRDFDMPSLLEKETFPPQLEGAGLLAGRDRTGCPVTYNFYGGDLDLKAVFGSPGGVGAFVRWRVRLMEQAVRALDFEAGIEHVMQVHDYDGVSITNMDANTRQASQQIISLFQDNYPELLNVKLFVNVPRIMEFLFGVMSAFVPPETRAKLQMVSLGRTRSVLLQYVDPAQLPTRFGGFLETGGTAAVAPVALGPAAHSATPVSLKAGETHYASVAVKPGSEVAWGVCTNGPVVKVSVSFRPHDASAPSSGQLLNPDAAAANGDDAATAAAAEPAAAAAAATAAQPAGAAAAAATTAPSAPFSARVVDAHSVALAKDACSGKLVVGSPGEVVLAVEYRPAPQWSFFGLPDAVVHCMLLAAAANEGAAPGTA